MIREKLTWRNILSLCLRAAQLAVGLAVVGFYAVDLNAANRQHKYSDGKWVRPKIHPTRYIGFLELSLTDVA